MYDSTDAKCADTCAEGTCLEDELCELVPVECVTEPCNYPDVAFCVYNSDAGEGEYDDESFSYSYSDIDFTSSWY